MSGYRSGQTQTEPSHEAVRTVGGYSRQARNTEAERRAGEILAGMEKAKGAQGNPGGRSAPVVRSLADTAQTLSALGISKTQSSRWQQLAAVPEAQREGGRSPRLCSSQGR